MHRKQNAPSTQTLFRKTLSIFTFIWCVFSVLLLFKILTLYMNSEKTTIHEAVDTFKMDSIDAEEEIMNRLQSPVKEDITKTHVAPTTQEQPKTPKLKHILYWNSFYSQADFYFGFGQKPFVEHNCKQTACSVTNDRKKIPMDQFDAIIIHGSLYQPANNTPTPRSPHQIVAFFSMEEPQKFPTFQGYPDLFNITITYRLDSDIPAPFFCGFNMNGESIAPSKIAPWKAPMHSPDYLKQFMHIHKRKSKPIAWFVSNCHDVFNGRNEYVKELQKYIEVDIYGACGPLKCPHDNKTVCKEKLKNDYFFYLALENANCKDYITERVYFCMDNEVVPLTMNTVDMLVYVPPYSYIDVRLYQPWQLAEKLKYLMSNPMEYVKYFWWRNDYKFKFGSAEHPFCRLCEMVHDEHFVHRSYKNFQEWRSGTPGNPMCSGQILASGEELQTNFSLTIPPTIPSVVSIHSAANASSSNEPKKSSN